MAKDVSKVRVALVGCGRISRKHADPLGEGRVKGAELVAVCDIRPNRARELAESCRVPWFSDMDLMVETVKPDLISLLTPSGDHADHILRLSRHGIPILCEKPLVVRLEDMDAVMRSCRRYGTRLGEVKQNRYNLAVGHLKAALDAGRLGTPRLASVRVWWARDADYYQDWHGTWTDAGGVLANQTIHHIDLLWWLLGDVRRVFAVTTYSDYTYVETGLCATLEFASGCIGTVEATTLTRPKDLEGSLAILGDRGTVELGGFAVNKIRNWEFAEPEPQDTSIRHEMENPPDVYGLGHRKLYDDLVGRLKRGDEFPVDGNDARHVLEIVHAIYQSMETGRLVNLCGKYPASRLGR